MSDESGPCVVCTAHAHHKCSGCKQVFYCSREHQKQDWRSHKNMCRSFEIKSSSDLGRYMVATRDLKPGDVILSEAPLVVGPKQITLPLCLGCYAPVNGRYRCPQCLWPLCGPECPGAAENHGSECVVYRQGRAPVEVDEFNDTHYAYEAVMPLRCLILQRKNVRKWQELLEMESHEEERAGTLIHEENQIRVVGFLRNYIGLTDFPEDGFDCSEKTIHQVCGILDVNALEIRTEYCEIQALYPTAYLMEHSCVPNTKHSFDDRFHITVKAAVPIARGEHIQTMYTHVLWGTQARRDHLKHNKYFLCRCQRCADPTELGTHFSSIKCLNCGEFLLQMDPLDESSDWVCSSCSSDLTADNVNELVMHLGEEVEIVQSGAPSVDELEMLLRKLQALLHPNHYHNYAVKHSLLQLYGRQEGYLLHQLPEDKLKRKVDLCKELAAVSLKLDPASGRLQVYTGIIYFELHTAVLQLARKRFEEDKCAIEELRKEAGEARASLKKSITLLQDEPSYLPEGKLAEAASNALSDLEQWMETIGCKL